ncbi:hypothetical protein OG689_11345 [Kitasatospora sp. NBC_00240]|uniref:hypothetical protein n=1 Tax=Kitasatospora sp. NBC_00240 TaxID=2903567 RepID=UPI002259DE9F|nr:hypothetical protein [Kitasatospora sp. NBC_00240]MCX5209879.1 hypothetical protein [Kitasatospora sp. NBC_00240]
MAHPARARAGDGRVRIVAGDFTEERGLLTPSLKVKRRAVLEAYQEDVALLHG